MLRYAWLLFSGKFIMMRWQLAWLLLLSSTAVVADTATAGLYEGRAAVAVQTIESVLVPDPVQERDVSVRVHLPAGSGPFPTVVYSHGAFCSAAMYDRVTTYWAAQGYAVLVPQHLDALDNPRKLQPGDIDILLSSRVRELSLLLDSAPAIAELADRPGALDVDRAAVGGHSFGAMIAMIKSGLLLKPGEFRYPGEAADARFLGAVIMSGVGPLPPVAEDGFSGLQRPLIASGGTLDEGNVGSGEIFPWQWRMSPYRLAPPGNKFELVLAEGDHYLGGLICREDRGGPDDPGGLAIVNAVTTAFLDAYVRDIPAARQWLESTDVPALTKGRAQFARK